jgi:hypothetical protein
MSPEPQHFAPSGRQRNLAGANFFMKAVLVAILAVRFRPRLRPQIVDRVGTAEFEGDEMIDRVPVPPATWKTVPIVNEIANAVRHEPMRAGIAKRADLRGGCVWVEGTDRRACCFRIRAQRPEKGGYGEKSGQRRSLMLSQV